MTQNEMILFGLLWFLLLIPTFGFTKNRLLLRLVLMLVELGGLGLAWVGWRIYLNAGVG